MEISVDQDKKKALFKKLAVWLLRIAGWLLLLNLLWIAQGFIYQKQLELKGPADFVGHEFVIYTPYLDDFFYTNPADMIIRAIQLLLLIGSIVLAISLLTAWGVHKAKLFRKIKWADKWLISGLIYAMVAVQFTAIEYSQTHFICAKFYHKVRECQTIADYEKLCGKAVLQKTVDENDSEFIKAIAWFENSGFQPGRELHIFQYRKPEVYLLVWSENGKIVHRDWCHQSAAKTSDCGLSDSNDVRLILIALQNMMNMNGKIQTGSEIELSLNSDFKIIYFHPYTDFDNTKLEESTKQELKEIAFSGEIPRIAVIKSGKVSGYYSVPLPLEPSRKMPMIWTAEHGKIKLKIAKSNNGRWGIF